MTHLWYTEVFDLSSPKVATTPTSTPGKTDIGMCRRNFSFLFLLRGKELFTKYAAISSY